MSIDWKMRRQITLNKIVFKGKHHETKPNSRKSERVAKLLEDLLSSVSSALKKPVCKTDVELDLRSSLIRVQEVCIKQRGKLAKAHS